MQESGVGGDGSHGGIEECLEVKYCAWAASRCSGCVEAHQFRLKLEAQLSARVLGRHSVICRSRSR
jgi:hypothetical protein